MEPNSYENPVWYEDSIVGMVEIRAPKKKSNPSEIKEEPTLKMDNQSIRFTKALQTFQ